MGRRIELLLIGSVAIIIAAAVCVFGSFGDFRFGQKHDEFLHVSGKAAGVTLNGLMRDGEIEFVVFESDWMQRTPRSDMWSTWPVDPKELSSTDVAGCPGGLYFRGTRADTSGSNKVFVVANNGLQPVAIEASQLRYLSAGQIERLDKSPIWPRIQAAVDEGTAQNRLAWKKRWGEEPPKPPPHVEWPAPVNVGDGSIADH